MADVTDAPYGCPPAKFPEFRHLHFKGVAKGCSIIKQVFESLRGDLFSADSPWGLGCVGGFVGSMNPVPRVRERVGEPLRMSLVGLCWYRVAKAGGGGGGRVEYLSCITQTFCTPSRDIGKK